MKRTKWLVIWLLVSAVFTIFVYGAIFSVVGADNMQPAYLGLIYMVTAYLSWYLFSSKLEKNK